MFQFIRNIKQGLVTIDAENGDIMEIFEDLKKVDLQYFQIFLNKEISVSKVVIEKYNGLKFYMNIGGKSIKFHYEHKLNIKNLYIKIHSLAYEVSEQSLVCLSSIFKNNIQSLTIEMNVENKTMIGYFRHELVNSKTILHINFESTHIIHIIGDILRYNKVIKTLEINHLTIDEFEIINNLIELNFSIEEIKLSRYHNSDFTHINQICERNKRRKLMILKSCMLMMRRRPDCIISLLPRRLLIYLLSYLERE